MSRFAVRSSKFRHIFGKPYKRDQCYDEVKVTKSSWDAPFCSVNPKFLAIITEAGGGGAFLILPLSKTGRVDRAAPRVTGHKDEVMDIAWYPFNDNIIASSSADCTIKIWEIPDEGLKEDMTEPLITLEFHQRKVGVIVWHPTASNILCSGGSDNQVIIWDVEGREPYLQVELSSLVFCLSFNFNGSRLVATTKDKKMFVIDAHTGDILQTGVPHVGAKGSQAVYLRNGRIITTGFSRSSERQIALFDENNLEEPVSQLDIDNSNGVMFPFYDCDNQIIYLCGKGDCIIRYYEITDEAPYLHFLNLYTATTSMRGFGYMHKRGLNVHSNEIARFYKLVNTGVCEVIPFIVPRKSELFQDDLYPDTPGDKPALTGIDWMNGKDADPILMSLKDERTDQAKPNSRVIKRTILPTKPVEKKASVAEPESVKNQTTNGASGEPAVTLPPPTPALPETELMAIKSDISQLHNTLENLTSQMLNFEQRILTLEQKGAFSGDVERDVQADDIVEVIPVIPDDSDEPYEVVHDPPDSASV